MRKLITISTTAFMFVALALVPGTALAKHHRAHAVDRNHDRIPDRWEKRFHLSLAVNQARRDQDHDGLNNMGEFKAGMNPRDADTNNNGIRDGAEHAGTIATFDSTSGQLTINLDGGGTLSARVTDSTEIECPAPATTPTASSASDGGSSGSGNSSNTASGDQQGSGSGDGEHSGTGSGNQSGSRSGDHGDENHCTTAALVPGASVDEAEVEVNANDGSIFTKVELGS